MMKFLAELVFKNIWFLALSVLPNRSLLDRILENGVWTAGKGDFMG